MRLGACKTVFLYISNRSTAILHEILDMFCCGSNCFVFWSRIVVLFEPYVRFLNILVKVRVTEWPPVGE